MCSSKPKIPKNKTPPAPLAPEAGPDALVIGSEREQMARARGIKIPPKVDLSGLGNQEMGEPVKRLVIRPSSDTPVDPTDPREMFKDGKILGSIRDISRQQAPVLDRLVPSSALTSPSATTSPLQIRRRR
jgi:hypothetical protein